MRGGGEGTAEAGRDAEVVAGGTVGGVEAEGGVRVGALAVTAGGAAAGLGAAKASGTEGGAGREGAAAAASAAAAAAERDTPLVELPAPPCKGGRFKNSFVDCVTYRGTHRDEGEAQPKMCPQPPSCASDRGGWSSDRGVVHLTGGAVV